MLCICLCKENLSEFFPTPDCPGYSLDWSISGYHVGIVFVALLHLLCRCPDKLRSAREINQWDIDIKYKVYQRLANEIFFRIFDGTYPLGTKLPTYQQIAREAGSSPETVRKAVRELRTQEIIDKTRYGFYVTSDQHKVIKYLDAYLESIEKEYFETKQKVNR